MTQERPAETAPAGRVVRVEDALPGEARVLEAAERSLQGDGVAWGRCGRSWGLRSSRRWRTSTPGNFATNLAAGPKFGYAPVGGAGSEPDGDARPVDVREARDRHRQEPGRRCAGGISRRVTYFALDPGRGDRNGDRPGRVHRRGARPERALRGAAVPVGALTASSRSESWRCRNGGFGHREAVIAALVGLDRGRIRLRGRHLAGLGSGFAPGLRAAPPNSEKRAPRRGILGATVMPT